MDRVVEQDIVTLIHRIGTSSTSSRKLSTQNVIFSFEFIYHFPLENIIGLRIFDLEFLQF